MRLREVSWLFYVLRLAQQSGIAQSSIFALCNWKSVQIIQTLEKICEGLDVNLAQVLQVMMFYQKKTHREIPICRIEY